MGSPINIKNSRNSQINFVFLKTDAFFGNKENLTLSSDESDEKIDELKFLREAYKKVHPKSHPSNSNSENFNDDKLYDSKNRQAEKKSSENPRREVYQEKNSNKEDERMAVDSDKSEAAEKSKIFHGILHIERLRNVKQETPVSYFVNYEGFWNFCEESTDVSSNHVFNYLKVSFYQFLLSSFSRFSLD